LLRRALEGAGAQADCRLGWAIASNQASHTMSPTIKILLARIRSLEDELEHE
jgi:hypothetical protein